jgi:hypothetical protein
MQSTPRMGEDATVSTPVIVLVSVVAAINLRLIVPAVLAFLGVWNPPASVAWKPPARV